MSSDENKHEIGSFREDEEGEDQGEEEQPPEVLLIPVGFGDEAGPQVPAELSESNTTENNRTPLVDNLKLSVWNYSKLVKWIAVTEALVTIFYLFSPFWPMIFSFFLPATGVVAGWKLHLTLGYVYLGYLFIHFMLRIIFMAIHPRGWFLFIQVVGLTIDLVAVLVVFRFIRLLRILPFKQKKELLNQKPSEPQQDNIA